MALASTEGEPGEEQFNYAWQAHRQPGSSFKTFVLTTAIKQGVDPYTTYYNGTSPITLQIPGGGYWTVHNAEPGGGVMPLSERRPGTRSTSSSPSSTSMSVPKR